ncbi:hypothetical protein GSbR_21850 [Geobacter sp. SVR]|nr:hypothetical protein GSVR_15970 [Geobacter sp. SVR]GCF85585.1 hypothetical protein GSbR_21850 [Geobacter sp. SVR]
MHDTFYTVNYRGIYIHAKTDRIQGIEIFTVKGKTFKSLHAAKLFATKCIKHHNQEMCEFAAKEPPKWSSSH